MNSIRYICTIFIVSFIYKLRQSLGFLSDLENCPISFYQSLKTKATDKEIYCDISTWDSTTLKMLGSVSGKINHCVTDETLSKTSTWCDFCWPKSPTFVGWCSCMLRVRTAKQSHLKLSHMHSLCSRRPGLTHVIHFLLPDWPSSSNLLRHRWKIVACSNIVQDLQQYPTVFGALPQGTIFVAQNHSQMLGRVSQEKSHHLNGAKPDIYLIIQ